MYRANNPYPFTKRLAQVGRSLPCKIATLVVTSGVSFAGSIVALQRQNFWPWVVAMIVVIIVEMAYLKALATFTERAKREQERLIRQATQRLAARRLVHKTEARAQNTSPTD